jgi:hypothetical protein
VVGIVSGLIGVVFVGGSDIVLLTLLKLVVH